MKTVQARNTNELMIAINYVFHEFGCKSDSRNGEVITIPFPVMTEVTHPMEMVNFNPDRDCNHVFHFMESLWILAGRKEIM